MTRRALLVGAQTNGLGGVLNDVEAMAQALTSRGFGIERLVTPDASRAGILDAYKKLVTDARPDDAIVLYYSGHGGRLQAPGHPDLQFIVPDDYGDSSEADFRGITGVELSVLLADLTDITPNTTVILDCCHAAHMSRTAERRVKSLMHTAPAHWHPSYRIIERHISRLVQAGLAVGHRALVSNPRAVRVVACAPAESAYESNNRDGVRMGLLTDALSRKIRASEGLRVNWSTLIDAVRRDVQLLEPTQRPEAEGPSSRQAFEMTDLDPLDTLPVVVTGPDRVQLLGAPLLSVGIGDEFVIMPRDAAGPEDGPAIGTVMVERLLPAAASAQLRLSPPAQSMPADARAHRTRAAAPALPVRLPTNHPVTADLVEAIARRPLLRQADPDTDAAATIEVAVDTENRLVIQDSAGPLHVPYRPTPLGISSIVANLQRIAQATALRRLSNDPERPLQHNLVIEWGRVRNSHEDPLPLSGAVLFANDHEHVYVRMRNDGDRAVYVSLVDIGISSRIAVLTAADPSGIRLAAGASYPYGWNEDLQRLTGVEMHWPEGIEPTAARPETILALISDGPVNVSVLQQQGVRTARRALPGLESRLAQIAVGTSRELGDASSSSVRYCVQPIDFTVSPTAPPTAERVPFLIDDRPVQQVRLMSPRGTAPGRVAVRIAELTVHRNRALGSADIRVDAVVFTGGSATYPTYRAETMRFSNVRDGERLPLDNVLIYHGPAVDFVDIAVWVSRDTTDSLALSALLEDKLTSSVLQAAGTEVASLAMTTPHAAAAVAVLGAGAVLVNTAYELLTGAVGASIGLYRTSLLAQEQFGVGRHERHPQDFSFTFSVDPV